MISTIIAYGCGIVHRNRNTKLLWREIECGCALYVIDLKLFCIFDDGSDLVARSIVCNSVTYLLIIIAIIIIIGQRIACDWIGIMIAIKVHLCLNISFDIPWTYASLLSSAINWTFQIKHPLNQSVRMWIRINAFSVIVRFFPYHKMPFYAVDNKLKHKNQPCNLIFDFKRFQLSLTIHIVCCNGHSFKRTGINFRIEYVLIFFYSHSNHINLAWKKIIIQFCIQDYQKWIEMNEWSESDIQ